MPTPAGSAMILAMRYRDAYAAIVWLCNAFGFKKHAVYAAGDIAQHAQLILGNGMIMLGSADKVGTWGQLISRPDEIGQWWFGSYDPWAAEQG